MALEVSNVEFVHLTKGKGPVKAFAVVTFNKVLIVKGFKIVEGDEGFFVGKPSSQGKDNKWYDNVLVKGKETWQAIQDVIIAEYEASDKSNSPKKKSRLNGEEEERPKKKVSREEDEHLKKKVDREEDEEEERPKKKIRKPEDDDDIFGDDED